MSLLSFLREQTLDTNIHKLVEALLSTDKVHLANAEYMYAPECYTNIKLIIITKEPEEKKITYQATLVGDFDGDRKILVRGYVATGAEKTLQALFDWVSREVELPYEDVA